MNLVMSFHIYRGNHILTQIQMWIWALIPGLL